MKLCGKAQKHIIRYVDDADTQYIVIEKKNPIKKGSFLCNMHKILIENTTWFLLFIIILRLIFIC